MWIQTKVIAARGLVAADLNGYSDPYTVLTAGGRRYKSKVKPKTLNPKWEEIFNVDFSKTTKLLVTVWDKDAIGSDDFLGLVILDMAQVTLDGTPGWFKLNARSGKSDKVTGDICLAFVPGQKEVSRQQSSSAKIDSKQLVRRRVQAALQTLGNQDELLEEEKVLELDLTGCELKVIPPIVNARSDWTSLDLGFNAITSWPDFSAFKSLRSLYISGNMLERIPPALGRLKTLELLFVNGNQLLSLPDEIGMLSNMIRLDVANNSLRSIPHTIGNLTNLEELNLAGNPLTSVPETMGQMSYMEILDMNACNLTELPEGFCGMLRLLELNLGTNKLTALPKNFGQMSRLVSLNISDNRISDLPLSMGQCQQLKTCTLDRNPFENEQLMNKYRIGTDHMIDHLNKQYFAYEQERKMKERKRERKRQGKKKKGKPSLMDFVGGSGEHAKRPEEHFEEEEEEKVPEWQTKMTPEEKLNKLKFEAMNVCHDVRQHLISVKRYLVRCKQLEQIVPVAQLARQIKWDLEESEQYILPVTRPRPPNFFPTDDQKMKLKKTTAVALKEIESYISNILGALAALLPASTVTTLARVIKGVNDKMKTAPGVDQTDYAFQNAGTFRG